MSRVAALLAGTLAVAATAYGQAAERAPAAEMEAAICRELSEQTGYKSLEQAAAKVRWDLGDALETAQCSYIFVDGGARTPAGHHIAARWRNQSLIPWIAEFYADRRDPDGVERVFLREGPSGDALDYLDAMVLQFEEADPEMAELFAKARADLREALNPTPPERDDN